MKWVRRDGTWHRALPEVGDHVWFIGDDDEPELQGELIITAIRKEIGQVSVYPWLKEEERPSSFNGWVVWWRDITYEEPEEPSDQYLYGIMDT